jgi:proteasome lid subunit RPN8/RPN11
MDREVGGVLLGGYYVDREARDGAGQEFITIDHYVTVQKGESKHASFRFTPEAWTDITKARNEVTKLRQEEGLPEYMMVGWHHTHPNFGIFLSSMDIFIQENFFNLHWQVALVVDPVRETLGFLRMKGQGTRPIRSPFYVIRDKRA